MSVLYEEMARFKKAKALADILDAIGVTSERAKSMTEEQWDLAAELANVIPPTFVSGKSKTVDEVVGMLNSMEAARERLADPDPNGVADYYERNELAPGDTDDD